VKGAFEMALHGILVKAAPHLVTFAAYEAIHRVVAKAPWRQATVTAMACGVRGVRKVEERAERARLTAADMFAEAIERSGEEVPASATTNEKVSPSASSGRLGH
jgi:chaperone-like protein